MDKEATSLRDDDNTKNDAKVEKNENTTEMEGAGSTLGKNGWHRALDVIDSSSSSSSVRHTTSSTIKNIKSISSFTSDTSSPLDQLTVTHILQNVQPQIDEMDAIHGEYTYLLQEIKALEKDRVQLEQLFQKAGRDASQESLAKDQTNLTYQKFRTNLRYMKGEDMKSLPLMWLEDVLPLIASPPDNNSKNKKLYAKLDKPFQDVIRNHRGMGLALLIADPQCKSSLIGRCYMNSNYGIGHHNMSPSAMLKREKAATLIDEGGEWLKHCAITGFDKANNSCALCRSHISFGCWFRLIHYLCL